MRAPSPFHTRQVLDGVVDSRKGRAKGHESLGAAGKGGRSASPGMQAKTKQRPASAGGRPDGLEGGRVGLQRRWRTHVENGTAHDAVVRSEWTAHTEQVL